MSSQLSRFKQMADVITKKSRDHFDHMSRLGVKMDLDSSRNIRLHIIANTLSFMKSAYDVNTRIEYMDDVITLNMPWGEPPDNPNFLKVYTAWKMLKIGWKLILSERRRYETKLIKVEFEEAVPLLPEDYIVKDEDTVITYEKVPKTSLMLPDSAWEMYFNYNDENSLEHKLGLRFSALGMTREAAIADEGEEDIYNSQEELYQLIENFGEIEIIERGWIVLALTFRAKHITPNEPIIVPPSGQQQVGMQQPTMIPVAQMGRTEAKPQRTPGELAGRHPT